jgi:hypothetical protein
MFYLFNKWYVAAAFESNPQAQHCASVTDKGLVYSAGLWLLVPHQSGIATGAREIHHPSSIFGAYTCTQWLFEILN